MTNLQIAERRFCDVRKILLDNCEEKAVRLAYRMPWKWYADRSVSESVKALILQANK